jgi:hypothetical protein
MEIVKLKDQTFIIKNFMSDEECKSIVKYLEWQVQVGYIQWNQISFYGSLAMGYWPSDNNLTAFGLYPTYFSDLKERIKNACSEALGIEMSEISFHAQKWITGAFADYHSDNSDEEGNPTAFERSKFASFAYLNDDFEGGLLKFKDSDITIKPEVGLLAIFAGGHENMHRVTTVESGERYTVGSFWDNAANEYTDEQRARWESELAAIRAEQAELYVKWDEDAKSGNAPVLPED